MKFSLISLLPILLTFSIYGQKIETRTINGLRFHFIQIDSPKDEFTVITNVNYGAAHDEHTKFAGRAHLWEHTIFLGSKNFPGAGTFEKYTQNRGIGWNASTGSSRTMYYLTGSSTYLKDMISLQGDMMSYPEFNNEAFLEEKKTVINEAKSYQEMDSQILWDIGNTELLSAEHPANSYSVGTQSQLEAMTIDDLKELFDNNYTPENMDIIITGNFEAQAVSIDELSKHAELWFHPPGSTGREMIPSKDPAYLGSQKNFQSYSQKGTNVRSLDVKAMGETRVLLLKYSDLKRVTFNNPMLTEILFSLINANSEGSLQKKLINEGLISGLGSFNQTINDFTENYIYFELTKDGVTEKENIITEFYKYLKFLEDTEISDVLFEQVREEKIGKFKLLIEAGDTYAIGSHYAEALKFTDAKSLPANLESTLAKYKPADIAKIIGPIFNPDELMVTLMAPEVVGTHPARLFSREIATPSIEPILNQLKYITPSLEDFKLSPMKLQFTSDRKVLSNNSQDSRYLRDRDGVKIVLNESHSSPVRQFMIKLSKPSATLQEEVAWDIMLDAFTSKMDDEISFLKTNYLTSISGYFNDGFNLSLKSSKGDASEIMKWYLEEFFRYIPTQDELDRVMQNLIGRHTSSLNNQTGSIIMLKAMEALHKNSDLSEKRLRIARTLIADSNLLFSTFLSSVNKLEQSSDMSLIAVGNTNRKEVASLYQNIQKTFKVQGSLSKLERSIPTYKSIGHYKQLYYKWDDSKAAQDLAKVRVFDIGDVTLKERIALSIVVSELNNEIFKINRPYGYVQAARLNIKPKQSYILLAGQTEGEANLGELTENWNKLLMKINTKSLSEDQFSSALSGVKTQILSSENDKSLKNKLMTVMSQLANELELKNIDKLSILNTIDVDYLYSIGQKYLSTPYIQKKYLEILGSREIPQGEISLNDCDHIYL